MCGLVGIASPTVLGTKGARFLSQALYADQLRGTDSTGVALIDKDNALALYKRALAASDFLQTAYGTLAMDEAESAFIALGHNRATTIGRTTNATAHPFHFGRYVGAHNGTISSHRSIFSVSKHDVDSMNLIDSLDKDGDPIETLKGIHTGAYAISVYDFEDQNLLFARNDERPLSLLNLGTTLLWGSEASMLYWLADRNGLLSKGAKFIDLKPHTLYRYCCNEMDIISLQGYTPKAAPYGHYSGGYGSNWGKGEGVGYKVPGNTRKNYAQGGNQHGHKYDFSIYDGGVSEVLQIDTEEQAFMITKFVPYNVYEDGKIRDEARGKCFGYLYCEEDDAAFPGVFYGATYKEYQEWMAAGTFLPVNVKTGYFTKDGNLTALNVDICKTVDADIFDALPSIYDEMFTEIWTREDVLAQTFCLSQRKFVELRDRRIIAAYEVISEGKTLAAGKADFLAKIAKGSDDSSKPSNVVEITAKVSKGGDEKKCLPSPATTICRGEGASSTAQQVIDATSKTVPGPDGSPISIERFMELTEKGCAVCASVIYIEDAHDMAWDTAKDNTLPVCPNCTSQMYKALAHRSEKDGTVHITRKIPAVN